MNHVTVNDCSDTQKGRTWFPITWDKIASFFSSIVIGTPIIIAMLHECIWLLGGMTMCWRRIFMNTLRSLWGLLQHVGQAGSNGSMQNVFDFWMWGHTRSTIWLEMQHPDGWSSNGVEDPLPVHAWYSHGAHRRRDGLNGGVSRGFGHPSFPTVFKVQPEPNHSH